MAAFQTIFGWSVSQYSNLLLIGAPLNDLKVANNDNAGAAYIYENIGGQWIQTAKLMASDAHEDAHFGGAVSLHGNKALIGSSTNNSHGQFSGTVYVFELQSGQWVETARLSPSDAVSNNFFGTSVSLFGNQALIGAVGNYNNGFETGAAYIFKLQNGNWLESMKLVPSDGASRMLFGSSVSLANNRALIGAHLDNEGGIYAGAAYVYESPNGAVWNETAKLTSLNPSETDQLGVSVSLSGNRALLGAYTNESGTASGSAYVFENDGNQWQQTAHIVPDGLNEMDFFGQSVSLSGNRALIGAHQDQDNGFNSGAAYYYELSNTTGVWDEKQKLGASKRFF